MKIYIASKAYHRPYWRRARDRAGVPIISRWIDVEDKFIGTIFGDPECLDYTKLWVECVDDVKACDVLVVYVDRDRKHEGDVSEVLKGALLEVGVALGLGKRVIAVGSPDHFLSNGTWLNHPNIDHRWCHINTVFDELKAEARVEES